MASIRIAFVEVHTLLTTLAYRHWKSAWWSPSSATAAGRVVSPLLDESCSPFDTRKLFRANDVVLVDRNGPFLAMNYIRPKSV